MVIYYVIKKKIGVSSMIVYLDTNVYIAAKYIFIKGHLVFYALGYQKGK